MIISASRRTDIPAFYAEWFINRLRAGFCEVRNPYNPQQVSRISLTPAEVDVICFWTRNPRPLFPHLDELSERGYQFYFQYTLLDYPRAMEHKTPPLPAAIATFQELSERIGPDKLIWRYDPIVFSNLTGEAFHLEKYAHIASQLSGYTTRSVISVLVPYRKTQRRMEALESEGYAVAQPGRDDFAYGATIEGLARLAQENGLEMQSCADELDLRRYGVRPGKCIDDEFIYRAFGLRLDDKKDPGQRKACGCVVSKDIGAYNTCLFGCQYCYATNSFESSGQRYKEHDPTAPYLNP